MPQKIIIDADPGIGDALAIAVALVDPQIDVLAITATGGRVSGRQATRNILGILEELDPPKRPRVGSSEAPSRETGVSVGSTVVTTVDLNGPTGMGECRFRAAEPHHPHESAKLMIELARNHPNQVTLLTLGPLTNVQVASERAPEFLGLLNGLVCQGGAIAVGGDVTAVAEFNIHGNDEAARSVLRSPATKTLVPLDVSREAVLTFEQFTRLQGDSQTPLMQLFERLLPFSFRAHHQHLGLEGVRLHELVALAAVSQPRLFETESLAIDVETQGELTRGMTVMDRRGTPQWQTNIDATTSVDAQGVLDYFSRIVRMRGV